MTRISGFTIVEVLIVVSIIAILSGLSTVAYLGIQKQGRDTTRKGNTTAIANALEKYYDTNNEYPSVTKLVNNTAGNTGTVVSTFLGVPLNTLINPLVASTVTNSLSSTVPTATNDYIQYIATSAVNNAGCQSLAAGGCDQFDLKYFSESSSSLITIKSLHRQ